MSKVDVARVPLHFSMLQVRIFFFPPQVLSTVNFSIRTVYDRYAEFILLWKWELEIGIMSFTRQSGNTNIDRCHLLNSVRNSKVRGSFLWFSEVWFNSDVAYGILNHCRMKVSLVEPLNISYIHYVGLHLLGFDPSRMGPGSNKSAAPENL